MTCFTLTCDQTFPGPQTVEPLTPGVHCPLLTVLPAGLPGLSLRETSEMLSLLPFLLLLPPVTVSVTVTGYRGVLSLFQDRVDVGLCRARCLHTYSQQEQEEKQEKEKEEELEQCWTVCELLSAGPASPWARLCEEAADQLCRPGCLTACSHFTALSLSSSSTTLTSATSTPVLQEDLSPGYRLGLNCSLSLPPPEEKTVFLVVGQDSRGDWYELSQSPSTTVDLVPFITSLVIIKISHTGRLTVRRMAGCAGEQSGSSWHLRLDSLTRDSGIFRVRVDWSQPHPVSGARYAVSWSIGSVLGVLETDQTSASLSLPPHSTAVIQVSLIESGQSSDSLTVHTPPLTEEPKPPTSSSTLIILGLVGATFVFLLAILGISIYLYRRTPPLISPATSLSASFTSQQEKSLISFESFVRQNRISVSDLRLSVNVDHLVV